LKSVVPTIAAKNGVRVGALAKLRRRHQIGVGGRITPNFAGRCEFLRKRSFSRTETSKIILNMVFAGKRPKARERVRLRPGPSPPPLRAELRLDTARLESGA
jgi:hypothetical protein